MKKIISILVVISLILSLSVTGFAWALRAPREEEGKKVEMVYVDGKLQPRIVEEKAS